MKKKEFIVKGLGSIGKRHAKFLNSLDISLIIIDPSSESLIWAEKNLKNVNTFKKIEQAKKRIELSNINKSCVISNWGFQHFETINKLIKYNVNNFFVEKPIVTSLKHVEQLKILSNKKKINLISGFQLRYSGLIKEIKKLSSLKFKGSPVAMNVTGGAFGMVENGIHFLDLAISIFNCNPLSVFSDLNNLKINPRSKKIDFYEGSSVWMFDKNKKLTISSSGKSSVSYTAEIFFKNGKIKIHEDLSLSCYFRKIKEIKKDKRITRLGKALKKESYSFKIKKNNLYKNMFGPFLNSKKLNYNIDRELISTEAMICSLISSKLSKKIFLKKRYSKTFNFNWKIS